MKSEAREGDNAIVAGNPANVALACGTGGTVDTRMLTGYVDPPTLPLGHARKGGRPPAGLVGARPSLATHLRVRVGVAASEPLG